MHFIKNTKSWAVRFYAEGKRKRLIGFKTKKEAEIAAIEYINNNSNVKAEITVEKYFTMWFERHVDNIGERTAENYAGIIDLHIIQEIGSKLLTDIDGDILQGLYCQKRKLLSGTRCNDIHKLIKLALNDAVSWGYLLRNPAFNVKPPKKDEPEIVIPEEWQVKKILSYVKEEEAYIAIFIAATTGMRISEIMALTIKNVDLDDNVFNVTNAYQDKSKRLDKTKTKLSKRRIKMLPGTETEIKKYWIEKLKYKMKFGSVYYNNEFFCTFRDGKQLNKSYVSKVFKRAVRKLNFDDRIDLKSLRHYHLSYLIQKGVNIKAIQERSGHAKPTTLLNTYTHIFPSLQDDYINNLTFDMDSINLPKCKLMEQASNGPQTTTLKKNN